MIRIHQIGYSKGLLFRNHSYPLRVFKKDLRDAGFALHFFHGFDSPKLTECDVLIFHGDNYRKILPIKNKNRKAALDFLVPLFEKFPHVIWFDENDGTRIHGHLGRMVQPVTNAVGPGSHLGDGFPRSRVTP